MTLAWARITTKAMLTNALSVTRATLHKWFALVGAPTRKAKGSYDLAAWREFARRDR